MNYPGGKAGSGVYQNIINQIPPHNLYVEGYLGGGAILRKKRPAALNIGIDINPQVISAWPNQNRCIFINCEFLTFLDHIEKYYKYASAETFIYLDPPYLIETRQNQNPIYEFEMTREDHETLLKAIRNRSEMIMISGYKSQLYRKQLAGWRCETFQTVTRGGNIAIEHLWMNYPEPTQLHDYSFLGKDFTDRQRIARKIRRLKKKLAALPALERAAILDAFDDKDKIDYMKRWEQIRFDL